MSIVFCMLQQVQNVIFLFERHSWVSKQQWSDHEVIKFLRYFGVPDSYGFNEEYVKPVIPVYIFLNVACTINGMILCLHWRIKKSILMGKNAAVKFGAVRMLLIVSFAQPKFIEKVTRISWLTWLVDQIFVPGWHPSQPQA